MIARTRLDLPKATADTLARRTAELATKGNTRDEADIAWKAARRTASVREARGVLRKMNGDSPRCMYCEHDRGSDIDHFRPRADAPALTFVWTNWNLSCGVCNSSKQGSFPAGLLNPTASGYRFEDHFEYNLRTGEFTLLSPEARATAPVFDLNDRVLQQSRMHAFTRVQATIRCFARDMDDNDHEGAAMDRAAVKHGPHRTILETIQRWYRGTGRTFLHPEVVAAIDRYPEILSW